MSVRQDPIRIALSVAVYIVVFYGAEIVFFMILSMAGTLAGVTLTTLSAALFANWLVLRVYQGRGLLALGLAGTRASLENLGVGLAGGAGAACVVLLPALMLGGAHWTRSPEPAPTGGIPFLILLLAAGSAGEEMLFHGYAFQVLLRPLGSYATVLLAGAVFALMHGFNPNVNWFGLLNTAGFGALFGYSFLRSRALWLPIGLHFGWNFTLPLFGVNLSGLRMRVTGHEMVWTAGKLFSGGDYGPEASLLTSGALILLFVYLRNAPLRRQSSPLTDPPEESAACEPSLPPPRS